MDLQIDLALDHDAAKKAGNSGSWNLYVRNWLNKCLNGAGAPQNGRSTTKRQEVDCLRQPTTDQLQDPEWRKDNGFD